jgi:hypothetical protein
MKALILAAALGVALSPSAPAQTTDAQAILARAKQAAGGTAWDAVKTLRVKAKAAAGGLSGTAESIEDVLTGRFADSYVLGPVSGTDGYDGTQSWSIDASGAVTLSDSGDAREGNADEAYRRSQSWWYPGRRPGTITSAGDRSEKGRTYHVLTITPQGGRPFELWIDAATFLFDRTVEKTSNETRTTFFSDYRDVKGLKIAFASRQTNGETKYDQTATLESVEVNPEIDAARFAPPQSRVDDFEIAGGKTSTVLPFRLHNNHLLVEVAIDGKPLRMLFDSGGANVLTPDAVRRLGLKSEGTLQGRGVGGSEDLGLTRVKEVRTGDVVLRDQLFFVLPMAGLADVEGLDLDGLIGFEVFKRFVVRVDYAGGTLTFTRPEGYQAPAGGTVVPFTFDEHTPQVEGKIDGIPGRFTIDTGSRASLSIHRPFAEKNSLSAKYGAKVEALAGWGVGGGVRSLFTRAGVLEIGGVQVKAPITDLVLNEKGALTDPYLAGNIGGGVLKRFTVTFDYSRQRLIFEPNANTDAPDVWDRAGMWINRAGDGFEVKDVVAGGPAAAAGLKAGDIILSFDGKTGKDLGLAEARQLLKGAPGTRVKVQLRGREAVLTLRELLPS